MTEVIYLRAKGGRAYGWGHVRRVLVLAGELRKQCNQVRLIIGVLGDEGVRAYLKSVKPFVEVVSFLENEDDDQERYLRDLRPDITVVDQLRVSPIEISMVRDCSGKVVVFNDLGLPYAGVDLVVCPQLLPIYPEIVGDNRGLFGPTYFLLTGKLRKRVVQKKPIREVARRILVVLGGSTTRSTVDALIMVLGDIVGAGRSVLVILGFDSEASDKQIATITGLGVRLIGATEDIGQYIEWCDIALSASGYLKYEIAALGTPAILVSIVEHQEELGKHFTKKTEAARYSGSLTIGNARTIVRSVNDLLEDKDRRLLMSQRGKQVLDGRGAERVAQAILCL
jgi:UDP-2,4-diacetamido-2,4,6-trideoxy-beta-L-altropyranose hydrolase